MSSTPFRRPRHQTVARALDAFDAAYLRAAGCYLGGGTRIVLELDEYRESADLNFLCADANGYRTLRNAITERSLGPILAQAVPLAREVRADRYGIRTFLEIEGEKVKIEIVSEGRIELADMVVPRVPVACLDRVSCFAEKFLANADRALDESVASRDLIDLAFMMAAWSPAEAARGLGWAASAYGDTAVASLDRALLKVERNPRYFKQCLQRLVISDERTLALGLTRLRGKRWRPKTKSGRPPRQAD